MKSFTQFLFKLALVAAALSSHAAFAHATLKGAMPADGATLDVPPKTITLQFNEVLESDFSIAKLSDSAGREITDAKSHIDTTDASILKLDVPVLASGAYQVQWRAVGHDGHLRKGDYRFSVK